MSLAKLYQKRERNFRLEEIASPPGYAEGRDLSIPLSPELFASFLGRPPTIPADAVAIEYSTSED